MKTILMTAGIALLVAVAPVRAEDETEMQAAQHDLQSARDHLKAAKHDYEGHRKDALDLVQRALAFRVVAAGDSYNDLSMLAAADAGILFRPPANVIADFPQFPVTTTYEDLRAAFVRFSQGELAG